jgi:hypothetical protein
MEGSGMARAPDFTGIRVEGQSGAGLRRVRITKHDRRALIGEVAA